MMKIKSLILSLFFILLCTTDCDSSRRDLSCFPQQVINIDLDLNLPAYFNLNNVGGWVYVNAIGAGDKGLIVVRSSTTTFQIYDRNAPELCPDGNQTILQVQDNIKIICPKDGAEWILLTGQPTKVTNIPPKMYRYNFNPVSRVLSIFN